MRNQTEILKKLLQYAHRILYNIEKIVDFGGIQEALMNLQEQFEQIVKNHDDMENDLHLAEGETYAYLQKMLPIECFLKEHRGKGLTWDYAEMRQEEIRFRKLSSAANIQISRHFRYDCSRCHTHDYFQLNYILCGKPV